MDLPRMQQVIRVLNLETYIPAPEISSVHSGQFAEFKHRSHRRFDLHLQEMSFETFFQIARRSLRDQATSIDKSDIGATFCFVHVMGGDEDRCSASGSIRKSNPRSPGDASDPGPQSVHPEKAGSVRESVRKRSPEAVYNRRTSFRLFPIRAISRSMSQRTLCVRSFILPAGTR